MAEAQPPPAAATAYWSSKEEAVASLTLLITQPPSHAAFTQLAIGPVQQGAGDPQVASLYLQAVSKHMVAALTAEGDELAKNRQLNAVIETVGHAATKCLPRAAISQSGILFPLAQVMTIHPNTLTPAHVEFLQCSLLAGQYRYARRMIGNNEWPRPQKGTSAEQVLRYYYLRGMIHMGCDNEWKWAIRCFWTCLSVPMNVVSAIAIEAWKKMVLCQCLVLPHEHYGGDNVSSYHQVLLALPASASSCLSRYVTQSNNTSGNTNNPEFATEQEEGIEISEGGGGGGNHQGGGNDNNNNDHHSGIAAYIELVKAFCTAPTDFAQVATKFEAQWAADKTTGMVERLVNNLQHRQVLKLASIYSVISVSQLATELGIAVDQVPTLLQQVEGLIFKQMDGGMVSLERFPQPETASSVSQLMALSERIRKLDVSLAAKSSKFKNVKSSSTDSSKRVPVGVEDF